MQPRRNTWRTNKPGAPHLDSEVWIAKRSGAPSIAPLSHAMGGIAKRSGAPSIAPLSHAMGGIVKRSGAPSIAPLSHAMGGIVGILLAAFAFTAIPTQAQWEIEESHTTASLRGIDSLGAGIAWASGANGTVRRTEDGGYLWQLCTIPPGAQALDFRAIQAASTPKPPSSCPPARAISCPASTVPPTPARSWKLVFTNPDKEGFWDAIALAEVFDEVFILGDPVKGQFRLFSQREGEPSFSSNWNGHPLAAGVGQAAFAASNSLIVFNVGDGMFSFVTGGKKSEIIHEEHGIDPQRGTFSEWSRSALPFQSGETSGAFSIAAIPFTPTAGEDQFGVAVGGDYSKPESRAKTAVFSGDAGQSWQLSKTPPPRLPLRRSLRPHDKNLDHRRPQRHRHLHR